VEQLLQDVVRLTAKLTDKNFRKHPRFAHRAVLLGGKQPYGVAAEQQIARNAAARLEREEILILRNHLAARTVLKDTLNHWSFVREGTKLPLLYSTHSCLQGC